jgi:hypothetical protein
MPSKTRAKNTAIAAKSAALPKIPKELLDQFVQGPMTAEAIQDVSMAFKKGADRAGAGRRAQPSPGLRAWWRQARRCG